MPTGIYKRTRPGWNKGKKGLQVAWNKGLKGIFKMPERAKEKISLWQKAHPHQRFVGQVPWNKGKFKGNDNYSSIHKWISKTYGSAKFCQNKKCNGKSKYFNWAKLPHKPHAHNIKNYIQLCGSCHISLDRYKKKIKL